MKKLIRYTLNSILKITSSNKSLTSSIFSWYGKIKNKTPFSIVYDEKNKCWKHYQNNILINVNNILNYNISESKVINNSNNYYLKYYQLKENDIVFDIGVGVGDDIFAFKKSHHFDFTIYGFEAHPRTCNYAKMLMKENSFNHVFLYDLAVSNTNDDLIITDDENNSASTVNANISGGNAIKVKSILLDDFIQQNDIKKINYIKFNIEGAEKNALLGLSKNIDKVENIVVACHDKLAQFYKDDPFFKTKQFTEQFLIANNFEIIAIEESIYHITIYAKNKLL